MGRIKEDGAGYYHIVSRVVDRRRVLNADEQERFRILMRAVESFSGCKVLTWTALHNHFHILLHVPERQDIGDRALLDRLSFLYAPPVVDAVAGELAELRQSRQDAAAEALKARYTYRMYDLSEFVKTLKQRFTQSYNRRHDRKGTLWEERFKSVVVGGSEAALCAVAAYIDLNAVRAGIVRDPKDYRFCGYAEAVAGSARARGGIVRLMEFSGRQPDWHSAAAKYRQLVYLRGRLRYNERGEAVRVGFSPSEVQDVLDAGGRLPLSMLLRCRVRYFTDGAVFGAREFVEDTFQRHRPHFGARRATGARQMVGADWGDLFTARRLRREVIRLPMTP